MKTSRLLILVMLLSSVLFSSPSYAVKWTKFKVCIDPGHGGSDPGASGPKAPHEGTLALRCGLAFRNKLQALGAPVGMTRTANTSLSLSSRRAYFLNQDPYVAISIHLNAFNKSAHGTETWYYWSAGNSKALANNVQAALVQQLKRANRGVKQNGWTVITASSSIPSVLTEGLFVDNPTEWNLINDNSKDGFKAWVNGHLFGTYDYLKRFNSNLDNPRTGADPQTPSLSVSTESVSFKCLYTNNVSKTFKVEANALSGNITVSSNSNAFKVSPATLGKEGGTVTVKFDPTGVRVHNGTVTVASGSLSKKVSVTGVGELKLDAVWNHSENNSNLNSKGWNAGDIRNMAYGYNGKLYMVHDHAAIKVISSQTGEYLYDLKTDYIDGGTLKLCDVIYENQKIIACNLSSKADEPLKIYAWSSEEDAPELVLETTNLGGASRLGDCMSFEGNWESGRFIFVQDDGSKTRIVSYPITNGVCKKQPTVINATTNGTDRLRTGVSTRVKPSKNGYWISGKDIPLTYLDDTGKRVIATKQDNTFGNGFMFFNYNEVNYIVHTTFNGSANYTGGCIELLNASDGWAHTTVVQQYPNVGLGNTPNINCTGNAIAVAGENFVEAWALSTNQGVGYFKFGTPPSHDIDMLPSSVQNPYNDIFFHVNGSNLHIQGSEVASVELYSLLGNKVFHASNTNNINISKFKNGIYIVRIIDVHANVYQQKVKL